MDISVMDEWQNQASIDGVELIVGALVLRDGRLFAHRRAYDRKLFPGCWDVAGGHVENGEKMYEALVREFREETQWELDEVLGLATAFDWANGDRIMREYDFVVTVKGNFEAVLEEGKAIERKWVGKNETAAVAEHGNDKMRAIFEAGFSLLSAI
ncbi:NUDIX domain-containing protein [Pararhizobium sp. BT-229]|uniref:NUDIX domain-containing protein n=1 Tax=Pararhizobium sp. BT-229 TaxID=2986923 RepID=UPI0021F76DC1|nr:NUDIX domain-containing protein [Pararhizobium sp. BT-229]MCV9964250.1 NUDIX domain-containing protein [Pararhizobium sp. BT-229]